MFFIPEEKKRMAITVLLWTFVMGVITHGEMIFNKISMHDDIQLFFSSGGVYSGRWAGGVYDRIVRILFGTKYSSPVISSFVSILFLALCAWILVDLLEIKNVGSIVAICTLSVVCPSVTNTFMYMISAPSFFLALFLSAFSAWLTIRFRFGWAISILLLSISLGIYQAYLGYYISVLLLWGIKEALFGTNDFFWEKVKAGVMASFGGVIGYLLLLKFFEIRTRQSATYNGMNNMVAFSLESRFHGLIDCYKTYYYILDNDYSPLKTTLFSSWIYRFFFLFLVFVFVRLLFKNEKSVKNKAYACCCFALMPIGTNVIYLLKAEETALAFLAYYPMVLVLITGVAVCEWEVNYKEKGNNIVHPRIRINSTVVMLCLIFFVCLNYIYISNATYMRLSFLQEKVISYQTTLVTQIKSADGYKDEYPVLWVGGENLMDESVRESPEWETIELGYAGDSLLDMLNNYAWKQFMNEHVGYHPEEISKEEVNSEVASRINTMPCYPDSGSIQVVDNVVIVKLGEE